MSRTPPPPSELLFDVGPSSDDEAPRDPDDPLQSSPAAPAFGSRSPSATRTFSQPLRSTISSREAEYELDDDELDAHEAGQLSLSADGAHTSGRGERTASSPRATGTAIATQIPILSRLSRMSMEVDGRGSGEGLVAGSLRLGGGGEEEWVDQDGDQQSPYRHGFGDRGSNGHAALGEHIEDEPDWLVRGLKTGAGTFAGVVNMANSILGAGIIGLPYAMREAGFFTGLFLLIILSFVTDWTIRLIVLNAKLSGRNTYIEIMDCCFGQHGRAAVSLFQFAFAFGGMCAFGVIIGDTIPHVLSAAFPFLATTPWLSWLVSRNFVIAFLTLTVSYPLSLYRNIESLSRASFLALCSMCIILFTVMVRGPTVPESYKGSSDLRFSLVGSGVVEAVGVISFAFVCHHNSLLIYGSLREPTLDRFAKVTHASTGISAVASIAMSLAGYCVFTDKTKGNILNNFPQDDTLVNVARFCFGVNMFTTFPLEAFVCREVIETYFYADQPWNKRRHIIFTTLLVVAGLLLSLSTCDLGVVLELTGGLSASILAYVFPSICYLKLTSSSSSSGVGHRDARSAYRSGGAGNQSTISLTRGEEEEDEEGEDDPSYPPAETANVGDLSASSTKSQVMFSKRQRAWYEDTRTLAWACAAFGMTILVISTALALGKLFNGRSGEVKQC